MAKQGNFSRLKPKQWYKTPQGSVVQFLELTKTHAVFLNKFSGNKIEIPITDENKPAYQLKPASDAEV